MGIGVVETGVPHADRSTFVLAGGGGGTYGIEIASVGVDDDDTVELRTSGADDLHDHRRQHLGADRERSRETGVLTRSSDRNHRGDDGCGDSTGCRLSNRAGDDRVGVDREVWAVLLRGAERQHEDAPLPYVGVREIAEPSHRASVGGLCPGVIPSRQRRRRERQLIRGGEKPSGTMT